MTAIRQAQKAEEKKDTEEAIEWTLPEQRNGCFVSFSRAVESGSSGRLVKG